MKGERRKYRVRKATLTSSETRQPQHMSHIDLLTLDTVGSLAASQASRNQEKLLSAHSNSSDLLIIGLIASP